MGGKKRDFSREFVPRFFVFIVSREHIMHVLALVCLTDPCFDRSLVLPRWIAHFEPIGGHLILGDV